MNGSHIDHEQILQKPGAHEFIVIKNGEMSQIATF